MTHFTAPVRNYMTAPAVTLPADLDLNDALDVMMKHGITSAPVVETSGLLAGILSRTDLLRVGRVTRNHALETPLLFLPKAPVRLSMKSEVVTTTLDAEVGSAARDMLKHRIHRVVVTEGGAPVGVLSVRDLARVIVDKRLSVPISSAMSSPVFTFPARETLSVATDRLEKAHVTGLVVIDEEGWPIGIFSQRDALESRELPASTPVEEAMSHAMICLPHSMSLHRAAAQIIQMRVRRVLAIDAKKVVGILSGLDLARIVANRTH